MFEFKNNHSTQVEIDGNCSRANAIKYMDKLDSAFKMLNHIESLLSGVDIKKKCETDVVITTAPMAGKDFCLQMLFSKDSKEPLSVKIIREKEDLDV